MIEERIWELLSLKLSGEATDDELDELNQLLEQRPGISIRLESLQQLWNKKSQPTNNKEQAFNRHLQRLSNHLSDPVLSYEQSPNEEQEPDKEQTPVRSINKKRWLWIAASAAAIAAICFGFLYSDKGSPTTEPPIAKNTVSTRPGSKTKIKLSDGTVVLLNAGSYITYNETFDAKLREVQLSGEAYFDVTHDEKRPFIIHTNSVDIRVLGTEFNVRSYPNEKTTETSLIRGSVEISVHNNPDKKIILKPNEKLVVNNSVFATENNNNNASAENSKREELAIMTLSKIFLNRKDSTSKETQWIKDRLVFEGEKLGKILADLEHLYNVRINTKNERLKRISITGDFENKSLHEIMEALRIAGEFNYTENEGVVNIW